MSNANTDTKGKQDAQDLEAKAKVVMASVDALIDRRKNWEANEFKTATEALYNMMGECLTLYYAEFRDAASDEQRGKLRKHLVERLQEQNIRVVKQTTSLTMLIRLVFASDGQRARRYSAVLPEAASKGVTAKALPAWIKTGGGIEEIKRQREVKPETKVKQQRMETTVNEITQSVDNEHIKPVAEVTLAGVDDGAYVLMLGKATQGGVTKIVQVLNKPSPALRASVIQQLAKALQVAEDLTETARTENLKTFNADAQNDQHAKMAA